MTPMACSPDSQLARRPAAAVAAVAVAAAAVVAAENEIDIYPGKS